MTTMLLMLSLEAMMYKEPDYADSRIRSTIVRLGDKPVYVQRVHGDMTCDVMKDFGIEVIRQGNKFTINPATFNAKIYQIPGDWSTANYFLAAAAITGSTIKVEGVPQNGAGEGGFAKVLLRMGCSIKKGNNWPAFKRRAKTKIRTKPWTRGTSIKS